MPVQARCFISSHRIELEAEARLLTPGEDRGSRRRTHRGCDITSSHPRTRLRESVNVGRRDLAAHQTEVVVTHVVHHDDDDVGARRSACAGGFDRRSRWWRGARARDQRDGGGDRKNPQGMTTKKMICIHGEVSLALLGMLKVLTL